MTNLKLQEIPVRNIRLQGEGFDRYVFNAAPRADEIAESIGRAGLNNPLTVVESNGAYIIVCGYARALALQRLNWWTVPCFVVDYNELGDEKLLKISIEDNRFSRDYHYLDAARILLAFRERCGRGEERLAREIAPLIGVPAGERVIRQYLVLNDMPLTLRGLLSREDLSFAHAVLLLDFAPSDAEAVARLFANIRLNVNEAREIAELLADLARSRKKSAGELLASEELKGLAKAEMRKALYGMRYPIVAAAEDKFEELVAELRLDTNVSVSHSPNFESDLLRVNIAARDAEEMSEALKKLSRGLEGGVIGGIFDIPRRSPHNNERSM